MAELNVVAVITAKPGSKDAIGGALRALVPPTRQEEGCLSYDLYESDAADTFVTVERWRDPSDLQAHLQSEHLQAALAAGGDHFAMPPAIHSLTPVDV